MVWKEKTEEKNNYINLKIKRNDGLQPLFSYRLLHSRTKPKYFYSLDNLYLGIK